MVADHNRAVATDRRGPLFTCDNRPARTDSRVGIVGRGYRAMASNRSVSLIADGNGAATSGRGVSLFTLDSNAMGAHSRSFTVVAVHDRSAAYAAHLGSERHSERGNGAHRRGEHDLSHTRHPHRSLLFLLTRGRNRLIGGIGEHGRSLDHRDAFVPCGDNWLE